MLQPFKYFITQLRSKKKVLGACSALGPLGHTAVGNGRSCQGDPSHSLAVGRPRLCPRGSVWAVAADRALRWLSCRPLGSVETPTSTGLSRGEREKKRRTEKPRDSPAGTQVREEKQSLGQGVAV